MKFKLPKRVKSKWIKALRSGKYEQCKGELKGLATVTKEDGTVEFTTGYCCLGVARACGLTRRHSNGSEYVRTTFLPFMIQDDLAGKNDHGYSFNQIADWIEENL